MQIEELTKRPALVFVMGIIIGGVSLGGLAYHYTKTNHPADNQIREGLQGLINPLILGDSGSGRASELNPIKYEIDSAVSQKLKSGDAQKISVYFRDMNSGQWTGNNEDETYAPASLIKIPMMMTYLKASRDDANLLSKQLIYTGPDQNTYETIKPAQAMKTGQGYAVDELIRRMIEYSDNNALYLLFKNMDVAQSQKVFDDLTIKLPADPNTNDEFISPKTFSFFLRTLYNSTYLGRRLSEKALEYLAHSEYSDGIVAGVPASIVVAHKFGEHPVVDQNQAVVSNELHDCGIIYYPDHPYMLCIMTSGKNYDQLADVLKDISQTAYTAAENFYK